MLMGILLIPILCLVGVAIDLQSVNTSRNFIQYTLDSAVIGGAKELQGGASETSVANYVGNYIAETTEDRGGLDCDTPVRYHQRQRGPTSTLRSTVRKQQH